MNAQDLTHNLHGKWHGYYGVAPCPVCQAQARRDQNALTLRDGDNDRLLLHCKRSGCAFTDILAATGLSREDYRPPDVALVSKRKAARERDERRKADQARRCWDEAKPIEGTPAEVYLRGRAITCPLPPTLRFHSACWHGRSAKKLPAMVAKIEGVKNFAVHRTYLPPTKDKLMLGQCAGGAVRLIEGHSRLAVAEGIETALSLSCGILGDPVSLWAALSTSGMTGLNLPGMPGHLTIAPDGDSPGRKAAMELAERATGLGWRVDLLTPPEGHDWNDILQAEAKHERL